MAPPTAQPAVPDRIRSCVDGYLNTSIVMSRLWGRLLIGLGLALPLAFWIREPSKTQALVNAAGLWVVLAVISRFFVYQFRLWRAAWVARRIDHRVPPEHPSRQSVIDWIRSRSDGDYLHTLLTRLDAAPARMPGDPGPLHRTFDSPTVEARNAVLLMFDGLLQPETGGTSQTHTYVTTNTQELRDGEWVTVESSTTGGGDEAPSEAIRKAMAILNGEDPVAIDRQATNDPQPPADFVPIPVASSRKKSGRKKSASGKGRSRGKSPRKRKFMPLEPDRFQPAVEDRQEPSESRQGDEE